MKLRRCILVCGAMTALYELQAAQPDLKRDYDSKKAVATLETFETIGQLPSLCAELIEKLFDKKPTLCYKMPFRYVVVSSAHLCRIVALLNNFTQIPLVDPLAKKSDVRKLLTVRAISSKSGPQSAEDYLVLSDEPADCVYVNRRALRKAYERVVADISGGWEPIHMADNTCCHLKKKKQDDWQDTFINCVLSQKQLGEEAFCDSSPSCRPEGWIFRIKKTAYPAVKKLFNLNVDPL